MRRLIQRDRWWRAIGFRPTAAQGAPLRSNAQVRVFNAGRRTGKTTCWAHEDSRVLASGAHRVAIFGPSHELVEKAWRVVASDLWRATGVVLRDVFRPTAKNEAPGLRHVALPNGAHLSGFSTERPDKSALGDGFDLVHVTEGAQIQASVYDQYILPSLMDTGGALLVDSTPRGEGNWFHTLHKDGQSLVRGVESWTAPSWTNTVAFPGGRNDPKIQKAQARMSRDAWLQEIEASFITFRGRCWPEFQRDTHGYHGQPTERPAVIFGAIDWGWTHPAALVVGGYTGSGRLIVLWSWEGTETRIPALMQIAAEATRRFGVRCWWAGHDRPENIDEFQRAGMPCERASNSRREGFDGVGSLLLPQDDGRPGLLVSLDEAASVASACERVRWREGNKGGDTETDPDGADSADALRYLAMSSRGASDSRGMSFDWL